MDSAQQDAFGVAVILSNGISCISCAFVIIIFTAAKHLRLYPFKLIFLLNLNDLTRAVIFVIPYSIVSLNASECRFISFLYIASYMGTMYWSLIISITMYKSIILDIQNPEKWFIVDIIIGSILSLIPAIIGATGDYIEIDGSYCVPKFDSKGDIIRFYLMFTFSLSAIFIIGFINSKVYWKMKKHQHEESYSSNSLKRFAAFPLIICFCTVPELVSDIFYRLGCKVYILAFISSVLFGLLGFFNAIAYTLTPPVIEYLKHCYLKICKKQEKNSALIQLE